MTATADRIDVLHVDDEPDFVALGGDFLDRTDDLPFVLYTGKGSEAVASDAIPAGVTDYLQKETGTDHYGL